MQRIETLEFKSQIEENPRRKGGRKRGWRGLERSPVGGEAWLSSAIIDIHNPRLDTSVKCAARRPHAVSQNGFIPWQKDRPKEEREKKEVEKERERRGRRIRERQQNEEKGARRRE